MTTTSEAPLVTVVLLCYNYERFVDEALTGLFAQTYKSLEIIIVDDCSPDRSAEIIGARLAQRGNPPNIRFFRNEKNGTDPIPGVLDKINGQFVFFASADDVMLPHMVETFVRVWREERVALVTSNALYIDENSNFLNRTFRAIGLLADDSAETLARDGSNACCFGAAMGMDRLVYETFGWPPTHFLQASDIILPFYAYFLGGARFVREPLLKYRVHSRNSSLSLLAERSAGEVQLTAEEKTWQNHVAHAILFNEELDRFLIQFPGRFNTLVGKLRPLVDTQVIEMSRKLTRTRKDLYSLRRKAGAV